jgi:hypothetical protein
VVDSCFIRMSDFGPLLMVIILTNRNDTRNHFLDNRAFSGGAGSSGIRYSLQTLQPARLRIDAVLCSF